MKKLLVVFGLLLFSAAVWAQKPVHLSKATFKEKVFDYETKTEWSYQGDKPAIIDFYADWCAPCRTIAPIMEDIAADYEGEVVVYKVDTEKEKELAAAFGISALPSILFIPIEGEPQLARGALPKETFEMAIKDVLNVEKPQ